MATGSPQLVRQWLLLRAICGRAVGRTVAELAAELEVTDKTIRRDLAVLRDAGFPLEEDVGEFNRKAYRIDPKWRQADLSFTYDEALALYLGRRYLEPLAGTLIGEAAGSAFRKVHAALGPSVRKYLQKIAGAFHETHFGAGEYERHAETLDALLIGIEDRRVVFITYRSQRSTEPVTYDVHPYCLTRHRGSLYLHGFKPEDDALRTWKVDRIEAAEVDRMPFVRRADFDVERYLAGSLGIYHEQGEIQAEIWFSPAVARYVQESRWHPSQRCAPQSDGSLLVELSLSGTTELKSWILSFGQHAEVRQPQSLRDEITAELKACLAAYDVSGAQPRKQIHRQQRGKPR